MLDAAHGTRDRPVAVAQRIDARRVEVEHAREVGVRAVGNIGRRRPRIAVRADAAQGSRSVAVARSSNVNRNRWNECRKETFLMNNV